MNEKIYKGYIIDKSQKDKSIFKTLNITNHKTIWLGLIKIYEVEVKGREIGVVVPCLQKNMTSRIGFVKQEFYLHFYCEDELLIVYRSKIFSATSDPSTWIEAHNYGKSLGIISKQLDYLTPEENYQRYFKR